jgi:hypothetical protein
MRKLVLPLLLFAGIISAHAQPVFEAGKMLTAGHTGPVSIAPGDIDPGTGSANATWDFSALKSTTIGSYRVVAPDSTPYFGTFPRANYALALTPTGSTNSSYEYDMVTSSRMDNLATGYTSVSGNNYNQNPETRMIFPFHYQDTYTDTFIKTTGGPYTVDITYERYGTLKTPYGTYNNVARIKYYWGVNDFAIHWMSVDPMFPIMVFSSEDNSYTIVGGATTGMEPAANQKTQVLAYPNPFSSRLTLQFGQQESNTLRTLALTDITGKVVASQTVNPGAMEVSILRNNLPSGLYFYSLSNAKGLLATGTVSAE